MAEPFRILCIDGGGIRGVIPAVFLQRVAEIIEQKYGQTLNEHFDLVAGTSTGAILATGIAAGKTPAQMRELYFARGLEIFPYRSLLHWRRLPLLFKYGLSAPKFDNLALQGILREELGELTFADIAARVHLLLPFYDTAGVSTQFFKSYGTGNHPQPKFADVPLWEAALCSASAPTYFPAHLLQANGQQFSAVDGGVAANNPVACALADALNTLANGREIRILSLGTGNNTDGITYARARQMGLLEWAKPVVDVLLDASLDVYRYITESFIPPSAHLRLQFDLPPDHAAMDDARPSNLRFLETQAQRYLHEQMAAALEQFL